MSRGIHDAPADDEPKKSRNELRSRHPFKSIGANLNIALVSRLLWLVMSRRIVLRKLSNRSSPTHRR